MPLNRNALMRIRTLDKCLCRRHRLWTLEDLRQACEEALYEYEGISGISIRTIQRDIELMRSDKLGYNAPIVVKDKKYYSYDDPDYSITKLPLSAKDLAELSSAMDILRHYRDFQGMAGQEDILARMQDRIQSQSTHEQIVYIETNSRLKGLEFLGVLYDYIAAKQPIEIDYKAFKSTRQSTFFFSPYFLKEYNNRWFLFGYSQSKRSIQNIALDRIIAVRKDNRHKFTPNRFFKPEEFLSQMIGVTRDLDSKVQRVVIRAFAEEAPYLITKPLHESQQVIKTNEDGSVILAMSLIINHELENKLMGLGPRIEVISPLSLRNTIATQILTAASLYIENNKPNPNVLVKNDQDQEIGDQEVENQDIGEPEAQKEED